VSLRVIGRLEVPNRACASLMARVLGAARYCAERPSKLSAWRSGVNGARPAKPSTVRVGLGEHGLTVLH
jgi:hypothetical protein